jgi:hypothetical protein
MEIFEVTIHDYPPSYISAATRSKARYASWLRYSDTCECTFKEFQTFTKVRSNGKPPKDGYDYVRDYYKIDVHLGQRVRLINEGSYSGKTGEVVYPGSSSQYVHVCMDDHENVIMHVHPLSVEPLPTQQ